MMDANMIAQVQAALAAVREDREESIVIRRGSDTLDAQVARIENVTWGGRDHTEGVEESRGRVTVLLPLGADIQPDDRFTDQYGQLYRVVIVRPDRRMAVIAQADLVA